jgi:glycine oxidase
VTTRASFDVAVIGGGAIGCAISWELARRGASVVLAERGMPGRETTFAAAGMLLPLGESSTPGPFMQLTLASMTRWPAFAAELREFSGVDVEYRASGRLLVALNDAEAEHFHAQHAWQTADGFDVRMLSGAEARELEPALSPHVVAALYTPHDHQVNNRLLGQALWSAAARAGVTVLTGTPVAGLKRERHVVMGVELADGTALQAGTVVNAAGCWAGQLAGLPRKLPVFPVRGQMTSLASAPPLISHIVISHRCYLVARGGSQILVGATVEHAGYKNFTTPDGLRSLFDGVVELLPEAAALPVAESWSGLRPGTPDNLPILGADPDLERLFYATGHYRNGILLTPITAHVLADMITSGTSDADASAFSIARFER